MIRLLAAFAAVAGLALAPGPAAAKAPAKAAAARDWSRTVAVTPDGGFRMGNPAARVKLVEYGSLACPHCRHFAETGYKPLVQNYVRTGKVSYEFRNFVLNGPDLAASVLTRCAGTAKFFAMTDAVFDAQPQWLAKAAEAELPDDLTDQQRVARFAQAGGLTGIAARFGVTPARARQCLADPKATARLVAMAKTAIDNGLKGTPTFFINGKQTDARTWEDLEPLIRQAGGRG